MRANKINLIISLCLVVLLFTACAANLQKNPTGLPQKEIRQPIAEIKDEYVSGSELTEEQIIAWALGCSAILAVRNGLDPYRFGMFSDEDYDIIEAQLLLLDSWDCRDRDDVLNIVENMTDNGHNATFEETYNFITTLPEDELELLIEEVDDYDKNMIHLTITFGDKWGARQIKAWDWFRMIHVLGWGYAAKYLELEETYSLMIPIIERLRSTFSSWEEANENYMDGFAWWSGTDFSDPASSYEYSARIRIYEELKSYPPELNIFDPTLWPDYIPDDQAGETNEVNFTYIDNGDGTCTIKGYKWEAGRIDIPEEIDGLIVTAIGDKAFYKAWGFKGLTIPDTVTTIGKSAFEECNGLSGSLTIPDSVTSIGERAFMYCHGFAGGLTLPNNLTVISNAAFAYCTGFSGELIIPEGVEIIESTAFYWCENFSGDLILPKSLKEAGQLSFGGCSGITGVLEIPENLTKIDTGTSFQYSSGITSINVSDQNPVYKSVDGILFSKDGSQLLFVPEGMEKTDYSIPDGTEEICENAFYDCSGFTGTLKLPGGVVKLERKAFYGCGGLDGITIPDSVTTIEAEAFTGCSRIKSITIPGGVTTVKWSMEDCDSLEVVEFLGDAPESITNNFFRGSTNEDARIIYNPEKSGWSTPLWNDIPCFPK